jgi:pSer/pThr/pTyr-binding forkhead associated (FHA) protein
MPKNYDTFYSGYEIEVLEGPDAGKTYLLNFSDIIVGRQMNPNETKVGWILFSDPTVSRMHAVLRWGKDMEYLYPGAPLQNQSYYVKRQKYH